MIGGLAPGTVSRRDSSGSGSSRFRPCRDGRTAGRDDCGRSWAPTAAGRQGAAGGCLVLPPVRSRLPGKQPREGRSARGGQNAGAAAPGPSGGHARPAQPLGRECLLVLPCHERWWRRQRRAERVAWLVFLRASWPCQEHHTWCALQVKSLPGARTGPDSPWPCPGPVLAVARREISPEIGRPPNAGWGALARVWMLSTSRRLSRRQTTPEWGEFDDSQPAHTSSRCRAGSAARHPRVQAHQRRADLDVGSPLAGRPLPDRLARPTPLAAQISLAGP